MVTAHGQLKWSSHCRTVGKELKNLTLILKFIIRNILIIRIYFVSVFDSDATALRVVTPERDLFQEGCGQGLNNGKN